MKNCKSYVALIAILSMQGNIYAPMAMPWLQDSITKAAKQASHLAALEDKDFLKMIFLNIVDDPFGEGQVWSGDNMKYVKVPTKPGKESFRYKIYEAIVTNSGSKSITAIPGMVYSYIEQTHDEVHKETKDARMEYLEQVLKETTDPAQQARLTKVKEKLDAFKRIKVRYLFDLISKEDFEKNKAAFNETFDLLFSLIAFEIERITESGKDLDKLLTITCEVPAPTESDPKNQEERSIQDAIIRIFHDDTPKKAPSLSDPKLTNALEFFGMSFKPLTLHATVTLLKEEFRKAYDLNKDEAEEKFNEKMKFEADDKDPLSQEDIDILGTDVADLFKWYRGFKSSLEDKEKDKNREEKNQMFPGSLLSCLESINALKLNDAHAAKPISDEGIAIIFDYYMLHSIFAKNRFIKSFKDALENGLSAEELKHFNHSDQMIFEEVRAHRAEFEKYNEQFNAIHKKANKKESDIIRELDNLLNNKEKEKEQKFIQKMRKQYYKFRDDNKEKNHKNIAKYCVMSMVYLLNLSSSHSDAKYYTKFFGIPLESNDTKNDIRYNAFGTRLANSKFDQNFFELIVKSANDFINKYGEQARKSPDTLRRAKIFKCTNDIEERQKANHAKIQKEEAWKAARVGCRVGVVGGSIIAVALWLLSREYQIVPKGAVAIQEGNHAETVPIISTSTSTSTLTSTATATSTTTLATDPVLNLTFIDFDILPCDKPLDPYYAGLSTQVRSGTFADGTAMPMDASNWNKGMPPLTISRLMNISGFDIGSAVSKCGVFKCTNQGTPSQVYAKCDDKLGDLSNTRGITLNPSVIEHWKNQGMNTLGHAADESLNLVRDIQGVMQNGQLPSEAQIQRALYALNTISVIVHNPALFDSMYPDIHACRDEVMKNLLYLNFPLLLQFGVVPKYRSALASASAGLTSSLGKDQVMQAGDYITWYFNSVIGKSLAKEDSALGKRYYNAMCAFQDPQKIPGLKSAAEQSINIEFPEVIHKIVSDSLDNECNEFVNNPANKYQPMNSLSARTYMLYNVPIHDWISSSGMPLVLLQEISRSSCSFLTLNCQSSDCDEVNIVLDPTISQHWNNQGISTRRAKLEVSLNSACALMKRVKANADINELTQLLSRVPYAFATIRSNIDVVAKLNSSRRTQVAIQQSSRIYTPLFFYSLVAPNYRRALQYTGKEGADQTMVYINGNEFVTTKGRVMQSGDYIANAAYYTAEKSINYHIPICAYSNFSSIFDSASTTTTTTVEGSVQSDEIHF